MSRTSNCFGWSLTVLPHFGSSRLATSSSKRLKRILWGRYFDLGTSGGHFASASFVNEAGEIAGRQTVTGKDSIAHATLWSRGRIIDLGAPGSGQCSNPQGINAFRQIVGDTSSDCDFSDELSLRAFLWQSGHRMVDVNTLISAGLGIQLRNIAAINDPRRAGSRRRLPEWSAARGAPRALAMIAKVTMQIAVTRYL